MYSAQLPLLYTYIYNIYMQPHTHDIVCVCVCHCVFVPISFTQTAHPLSQLEDDYVHKRLLEELTQWC